MPYLLKPAFQTYAWGDKQFIQQLCGLGHKVGTPLAEMWLGAHPKAPSQVMLANQTIALNEFINRDPLSLLGSAAKIHQQQLPFLLKILAAGQPLSIQVHPDLPTAVQGFKAENEAKIALDDPKRSFKDDNHKPELLLALTEFSAMCGFRSYVQIISLFSSFSMQNLWPAFSAFQTEPNPLHLKDLYRQILDSSPDTLQHFMLLLTGVDTHDLHPTQESELKFISTICQQLNSFYPLDPGIVSPLLLNTFTLQPGQVIYLEPGIIHAYIKGAGVEIMANSDNVLRGGLTPKYIDKDKLFAISQFQPSQPLVQEAQQLTNQLFSYAVPVREFSLGYLSLDGSYQSLANNAPAIALCLTGYAATDCGVALQAGTAIFIPANDPDFTYSGKATIVIASSN